MSEIINNREYKQTRLKEIIRKLHSGVRIKDVKSEFKKLIKNVSPEEIADMENALINEGFPPEEIMKLCDVHVQVFEDAIKIDKKQSKIPGHPVHSYIKAFML